MAQCFVLIAHRQRLIQFSANTHLHYANNRHSPSEHILGSNNSQKNCSMDMPQDYLHYTLYTKMHSKWN